MATTQRPTRVPAWEDSHGVLHRTIEGWQRAELGKLYVDEIKPAPANCEEAQQGAEQFAGLTVDHADAVLAILTTGPRSRPRARKAVATTNPRRAAKRATPEQAKAGFTVVRAAVNGDEPVVVEQPITH